MLIFKRATPYWTAVTVFILLHLGLNFPLHWPWFILATTAVIVIVLLILHQQHWRSEYVGFGAMLWLLILSGYTFALIQENYWITFGVSVGVSLIYFLFVKNVTWYVYVPGRYVPNSLEYMATYTNIVSAFFLYVSLFIFDILHIVQLRYILITAALFTALLVWQTFWIQKISWQASKGFIVLITLILTEAVAVLHFWPVSFFVSGALLSIVVYVLVHLTRHHLTHSFSRQVWIRYGSIAGIAVIIILSTARWFN